MNWGSWGAFLEMGGHAPFVWGSFGVTALVIVAELWSLRARRRALRRLDDGDDEPDVSPQAGPPR